MGEAQLRNELDLQQFLEALRRRWLLVFLSGFIASVATAFYTTCVIRRTYQANVTLLMPIRSSPSLPSGLTDLAAQLGVDIGHPLVLEGLYKAILESRLVRRKIARRFRLSEFYGTQTDQQTVEALQRATKVAVKMPVITVTVTTTGTPKMPLWRTKHPRGFSYGENDSAVKKLAADIANAYAHELQEYLKVTKVARARVYREFLEKRFAEFERSYEELTNSRQAVPPDAMLNLPATAQALITQRASLIAQVASAEAEAESLEKQLNQRSRLLHRQLRVGLAQAVEGARQRLLEEEFHLAVLRQKFGEEHPSVREQAGRVAEARKMLSLEARQWQQGLEEHVAPDLIQLQSQHIASKVRAQALKKMLSQTDKQLEQLAAAQRRQIELETIASAYKMLSDDLVRAQMAEKYEGLDVEVLDEAIPPESQSKPRAKAMIVLAGILGVMAGTVLALFVNRVL